MGGRWLSLSLSLSIPIREQTAQGMPQIRGWVLRRGHCRPLCVTWNALPDHMGSEPWSLREKAGNQPCGLELKGIYSSLC